MQVKTGRSWSANEPRSISGGEVAWAESTGPLPERHTKGHLPGEAAMNHEAWRRQYEDYHDTHTHTPLDNPGLKGVE
jgi:hypothetical protein